MEGGRPRGFPDASSLRVSLGHKSSGVVREIQRRGAFPGLAGGGHAMKGGRSQVDLKSVPSESTTALLRELVSHLRQHRTQLREEWAQRITEARLLTAMTKEEVFAEATSVYDNY